MKKSHPKLFNSLMVRAILEGRKTETRRGGGKYLRSLNENPDDWLANGLTPDGNQHFFRSKDDWFQFPVQCQVGDEIWVKETYALIDMEDDGIPRVEYRADTNGKCRPGGWPDAGPDEFQSDPSTPKWKPSIFMPRKFSRITLRVTGERIERLQEIGEEGAISEGIKMFTKDGNVPCAESPRTAREAYSLLWNSINPEMPWDSNPWVRAIRFERIK